MPRSPSAKHEVDQILMERHPAKKARRSNSKHHLKGPAKRTEEDDRRFEESFEKMMRKVKGILRGN